MANPISILCVCTFNRTRSVLMEALLTDHLRALDVDAVVGSAGTRAAGGSVMPTALALLAERGLTVDPERGAPLDEADVRRADLVVTAEQGHVVDIAGRWPGTFDRTFTLPELVGRTVAHGRRNTDPVDIWLTRLNTRRPTGLAYLEDLTVGAIDDPTGLDRRTWLTVFTHIDQLTRQLAEAVAT